MARLNERVFARLEEVRDVAAPHQDLRLPAADGGVARRARAVRQRSLRVDAVRPADPAARRVLHERHAGRHAGRSAARRHRPPVRRRAGGGRPAVRARQGVLRRTAAQGSDDRRVGPCRREPPSRGAEGGRTARRLRGDGARRRGRRPRVCRSATAATAPISHRPRPTSPRCSSCRRSRRRRRSSGCCRASTRIRAVVDSADRYRADTPWAMRWGLYQGGSIGNSARDAYVRELDGMLLPRVAARIKARLVEYALGSGEAIRLSQGVSHAGRAQASGQEAPAVAGRSGVEEPDRAAGAAGRAVDSTSRACSITSDTLRPIAMDPALVAQARSSIRQASIAADHVRPDQAHLRRRSRARRCASTSAGVGVEQVFRRKSGVSLSEPVPACTDEPVFKEITDQGRIELVKQFAEDGWVWGEESVSAARSGEDRARPSPTSTSGLHPRLGRDARTISSSCRSRPWRRRAMRSGSSPDRRRRCAVC